MLFRSSILSILIIALGGSIWMTPISAQSPRTRELYPWEADWFTRWGTNKDDLLLLARGKERDTQLRKYGVAKRFREMVAAGRAGDQVARTLVAAELNRRCNGGKQLSRADCAAWRNWLTYHTDPIEPHSQPIHVFSIADLRAWGDKDRFLEIGRLFELGIGGPADYETSRFFYSWVALLGTKEISAQAKFNLGVMAEKGLGSPADRKAAYSYYEQAERDGHPTAALVMGAEILRLDRTAFDSAAYSFRQAGDGGISEGSYRYAMLLFEGKASVRMSKKRQSPTAAETCFVYFKKAAFDGHVRAMAMLGTLYRKGLGVPEDSEKALEWWKRAARSGDAEAAWLTAGFYSRQDKFSDGLPWLKRAAAGEYPGARSLLRQWESKGVREKGLLSGFLSVMQFIGDVAAAYEQQRQAQIDYDNAIWLSTYNALNSGSSNSSDTSSASSGTGAGSLDGSGGTSSAMELEAVTGSSSGTDAGRDVANGSSSNSSSSGTDGDSTDSNSGTSDKSSGGSGKGGALIVSDSDHKKWKLAQAKQELAYVKQREKEAADLIRARASGEAETARIKAEAKRRSDARLIACHGSLEAAAKAKVSCQ